MGFRRIPRGTVLAGGAAVIAVAALATTGIGQAAAANGPTVYLNRHGGPTVCGISVNGTLEDGSPYRDEMDRPSCDGTFELPVLKKDTELFVSVWTELMAEGNDVKTFTVTETLDNSQDKIDNKTAICFLAKAGARSLTRT